MAEDYGSGSCHCLLTRKGKAGVISTVCAITEDEANLPEMKSQMLNFNKDVSAKIGDSIRDEDLKGELLKDFIDTLFEDNDETSKMEGSEVPEIGDFTPK